MYALKNAMKWDEQIFGLEYDLDIFNIAAVSDFNAGAMENKGLNIFNTAYVLASADTATDADFQNVERVIAHEYFHNWTGDRVTCRDWFQLSLKEGLTVFRDQEYMADQFSAAVKRIADVRLLRATQFRDDAGPLAHAVRPASYLEINNFYTTTIYEKGAEVVRMYRTLIGGAAFRKGMDIYIARNDNSAATVEDFFDAMQAASPVDLRQIMRWYEQAGTPEITFEEAYDATAQRFTLTLRQRPGRHRGRREGPVPDPGGDGAAGRCGGGAASRDAVAYRARAGVHLREYRRAAGTLAVPQFLGTGEAEGAGARASGLPGGEGYGSRSTAGTRCSNMRRSCCSRRCSASSRGQLSCWMRGCARPSPRPCAMPRATRLSRRRRCCCRVKACSPMRWMWSTPTPYATCARPTRKALGLALQAEFAAAYASFGETDAADVSGPAMARAGDEEHRPRLSLRRRG